MKAVLSWTAARPMPGSSHEHRFCDVCVSLLYPPIADLFAHRAKRRDVPCVDGSELARRIFTLQAWSVQQCVRRISAVHTTAGHNALRGSGPGQEQEHAFKDALAHCGLS